MKSEILYIALAIMFLGALAYAELTCDGDLVRGLFWLKCIK